MEFPNYKEWAHLIHTLIKQDRRVEVEQELNKIFEQGYHLGVNHGWHIEQEKHEEARNMYLASVHKDIFGDI